MQEPHTRFPSITSIERVAINVIALTGSKALRLPWTAFDTWEPSDLPSFPCTHIHAESRCGPFTPDFS